VRVNLTGARTPEGRVRVLVEGPLAAAPLVASGRLLDVGSGNGSPGLVLALLRDDLEPILLEPRARRWAFLREAARSAGRSGVRVLRQRHDAYPGPPAETVTLRALALPLGALGTLVTPGGRVLFFGGAPRDAAGFVRTHEGDGVSGGLAVFRREA
jgi:16S rRNA (guanine527-N7)-methyltransferase